MSRRSVDVGAILGCADATTQRAPRRPRRSGAIAGAVTSLTWAAREILDPLATAAGLPERLWTRVSSPRLPKRDGLAGLTAPEQDAVGTVAGRIDARMVWSSNRSGNHELYLLDLREGSVRRLTNNPAVTSSPASRRMGGRSCFSEASGSGSASGIRAPGISSSSVPTAPGSSGSPRAATTRVGRWMDGRAIIFHRDARVFRYEVASRSESLADARRPVGRDLPGRSKQTCQEALSCPGSDSEPRQAFPSVHVSTESSGLTAEGPGPVGPLVRLFPQVVRFPPMVRADVVPYTCAS
jgi:hypothetical protein